MTCVAPPLPAGRRREVVRQGLSVGLATGLYGVSFGALSVAAGVGFWSTIALSALMFTGGSQFAFVGVVAAGGGPFAAVATSTLLGVRNAVYGMQVARWLHVRGPRRVVAAHLTIDESFAVGSAQAEPVARRIGFWVTGVTVFAGWNLMTAVGALAGDRLGDPRRYGLDAMAAAAFLALLWPRLTAREPRVVAVFAAAVALVCVPVLPAGLPVLAAGVVALASAVLQRRRERPTTGEARP
ncbi:AzlC family ABC transporter permease [Angustibacter luteus]|uniref:AzlC family ABC transporter permease n=1 Tax=Angustibacter luteus TaxID=658456 RepID=A0ABW1J8H3_9ACTN